jgi:hypothetical protein
MSKISYFDQKVFKDFLQKSFGFFAVLSATLIFVDIPEEHRITSGVIILVILILFHLTLWIRSNRLQDVWLSINSSTVNIKTGDIFEQSELKVIAFNEYFDTTVDEKIIAKRSINGVFLEQYLDISIGEFDDLVNNYEFDDGDILETDVPRKAGKKVRYKIGSICVFKDFLITAFSKFDDNNRANLTMPEYLEFLINFWDKVNKVYAQKSVSTTIFGSGITRIKEHINISDEELLKIMLWTFRISEMRFKYPAKLTIVIPKEKIDQINLFEMKFANNGI